MKYLFIEGSLKKGWSYIKNYFLFHFDSASYVIELQHNNIVFNLLFMFYIFDTNYRVKLNKYIYFIFQNCFTCDVKMSVWSFGDLLVIDFSNVVSCLFFIICHYFRYLKYIYLNSLLLFYLYNNEVWFCQTSVSLIN